jgi:transposase
MSLPSWVLPFKEARTAIRRIKGAYYKYKVSHHYDPARKRTVPKTGVLLGKITEKHGFIPSPKNTLRQQGEALPQVDIKTFGLFALFENLLREETPSLIQVFGQQRAQALLSFAMFRWAYQSPIKRALAYQMHDYCSERWNPHVRLSDKYLTSLLRFVGENRQAVVSWMRGLLPWANENFVLMDSTHLMSSSEHLGINAKGYNGAGEFGRQLRLMYLFQAELCRPAYYRLLGGNIPDISSMSLCIKELGLTRVIFIADKGFYSQKNIQLLDEQGLYYVVPLRRNNPAIDYRPLAEGDFKKSGRYFLWQGRVIWQYEYERDGKAFVTYLDERLRVEEEQDYLHRIESHPETNTEGRYFEKLHCFGTLTLTWRTETAQSAQYIYEAYKQRNEIEMMFDSYKTFLKADVLYMQDRHVLEGWLFVNFLAMLGYYKLYTRLREAKLLAKESPKDIIELAKAVYQTKVRGQWNLSEIPQRVKKLFGKIKIDNLT